MEYLTLLDTNSVIWSQYSLKVADGLVRITNMFKKKVLTDMVDKYKGKSEYLIFCIIKCILNEEKLEERVVILTFESQ